MPLHNKIQSLFEQLDARVDAAFGYGGQNGYYHQTAQPYNTYGQHNGPYGWHQQQAGGPSGQWQQQGPQSGSHLNVPPLPQRPRGNSAPAARDRDNNGIPFDAPPPYEESSRPETVASQPARRSQDLHPALPGDHWAPTNPFRDTNLAPQNSKQHVSEDDQPNRGRDASSNHFPPFRQPSQPPPQHGPQAMFPLTFELWYNTGYQSSRTELHMAGQGPDSPAFVATFSLGWKGKTELHERSANGPVILSAKSINTSGTKQGMTFPDGSTIELKTSDLKKFHFIMPTGPGGLPEKFIWKRAKGGDMREISPIYMGWKLVRESSDEVLAVFGEQIGWKNGVGKGTFAFVGAARSGMLSAHWQNVAVFSFIKVSHEKFVENITSSIAGAV